jgi:hypothetical protein
MKSIFLPKLNCKIRIKAEWRGEKIALLPVKATPNQNVSKISKSNIRITRINSPETMGKIRIQKMKHL